MRTLAKAALAAVAAAPLLAGAAQAQPAGSYVPGSYLQSCANVHMAGPDRLVADCPDSAGRFGRTAIDWRLCGGDIYNADGRLQCEGRAGSVTTSATVLHYRDRPPAGPTPIYPNNYPPPPASITLHSRTGFGGSVATFEGPIADLREVGFSGYAESAVVSPGSQWQVCTAPGFRGRCVVVNGSTPDLTVAGIGGPVWSVRPVN